MFEMNGVNIDSTLSEAFKRELHYYIRWALLEGAPGPSIPPVLFMLGRQESLRRLERARHLSGKEQENHCLPGTKTYFLHRLII